MHLQPHFKIMATMRPPPEHAKAYTAIFVDIVKSNEHNLKSSQTRRLSKRLRTAMDMSICRNNHCAPVMPRELHFEMDCYRHFAQARDLPVVRSHCSKLTILLRD